MSNEDELDIRSVHPSQRHPMIFEKFDNLAKGEKFVLINDHDPKPVWLGLSGIRS